MAIRSWVGHRLDARRPRSAERELLEVGVAMNLRPEVSALALDNKRDVYELLEMFDERAAIREYEVRRQGARQGQDHQRYPTRNPMQPRRINARMEQLRISRT